MWNDIFQQCKNAASNTMLNLKDNENIVYILFFKLKVKMEEKLVNIGAKVLKSSTALCLLLVVVTPQPLPDWHQLLAIIL